MSNRTPGLQALKAERCSASLPPSLLSRGRHRLFLTPPSKLRATPSFAAQSFSLHPAPSPSAQEAGSTWPGRQGAPRLAPTPGQAMIDPRPAPTRRPSVSSAWPGLLGARSPRPSSSSGRTVLRPCRPTVTGSRDPVRPHCHCPPSRSTHFAEDKALVLCQCRCSCLPHELKFPMLLLDPVQSGAIPCRLPRGWIHSPSPHLLKQP